MIHFRSLLIWIRGALVLWAGMALSMQSGAAALGEEYFPNIPLVTHEGKSVRFFDDLIKGKVVAINFIYTTCNNVCPLETAQLKKVKQLLGDRVGRDVFMYSITIDPSNDTPEVLKQYAEKFDVGSGWTFLTGKEADIIMLRQKFGLYIEEIQGDDSTDHNINFIIGNQSTGRWMTRSPFQDPYALANDLGGSLHNWKQPVLVKRNSDEATQRSFTAGEKLFRSRCASCHTIGTKGTINASKAQLGPDLLGVTHKREREWLTRWLAEPEKMLAQKDSIALALVAEYKIPMPNLSLTQQDIDALLEYIEAKSQIVEAQTHDHSSHSHAAEGQN